MNVTLCDCPTKTPSLVSLVHDVIHLQKPRILLMLPQTIHEKKNHLTNSNAKYLVNTHHNQIFLKISGQYSIKVNKSRNKEIVNT